jgi:hypothetical protein
MGGEYGWWFERGLHNWNDQVVLCAFCTGVPLSAYRKPGVLFYQAVMRAVN